MILTTDLAYTYNPNNTFNLYDVTRDVISVTVSTVTVNQNVIFFINLLITLKCSSFSHSMGKSPWMLFYDESPGDATVTSPYSRVTVTLRLHCEDTMIVALRQLLKWHQNKNCEDIRTKWLSNLVTCYKATLMVTSQ